jgi:hypothetical protein
LAGGANCVAVGVIGRRNVCDRRLGFASADADARHHAGRVMMKSEVGSRKSEGERCARRWICLVVVLIIFSVRPSSLFADGGTLRLSQRDGDLQVSAFTSPAVLRVGMIDVSVLIQDAASGRVRIDLPSVVRLQSIEDANLVVECATSATDATNKLFRAALVDVPRAGNWKVQVLVGQNSADDQSIAANQVVPEFQIAIGPPLPAWLEIAPWISWPFAVVGLFFVHQAMKSGSIRRVAAIER